MAVTVIVGLCSLLPAATAGAQAGNTTLQGDVTITGTAGRDDLTVEFLSAGFMEVEPAATVTAASGICNPETDPVTGRPVRNFCRLAANQSHQVLVDLRGGNDALEVDYDPTQSTVASISRITGSGSTGNDVIVVDGLTPRVFLGGEGDDVLAAPGSASGGGGGAVTWDGGAGTDIANFAGSTSATTNDAGIRERLSVSASLATGTATLRRAARPSEPPGLFTVRSDTLLAIEGVTGGAVGDILTGGVGPDILDGGDGPDNLAGGAGADTLSGGTGLDDLNGGGGGDTIDGGIGIDTFAKGAGGDTFLIRDGFAESVLCVKEDVVIGDLADRVVDAQNCKQVSIAQAKHRYDTEVGRRAVRLANGGTRVKLRCPADKTERCAGTLIASAGGGDRVDYRIPRGDTRRVVLEGPSGKRLKLRLSELDEDDLPRSVVARLPVRRAR